MPPSTFLSSQLSAKIPYPTHSFEGQTIIVTGSNTGMGLEAARHFARLSASKVILAVRNLEKGNAAKLSIEESTKRLDVVEVWELDLASYASVKAFAARARALERLDVLVSNAGIYVFSFKKEEDNESTITVNVVSTFLLALLVLPKMRETSVRFKKEVMQVFVGSFVHYDTKFPERTEKRIFEGLAREQGARMKDRYNVSKMIELLCMRAFAEEITKSSKDGKIITNLLNPGFVATEIMRNSSPLYMLYVKSMKKILSRTTEVGGRILVSAAIAGDESHGKYLDDCKIGNVSPFVESKEGEETQKRLWNELSQKLEEIETGIMSNI